ncbi:aldehyde dehydrogenase [Nevskia ramosa]|uniref:aldehyde dehydrogenase n=1 Tax=Nevskia ramosa TaxID=64002 RepID=UPI0003B55509|nr:aldehyde dehydrogenase [Nevskia ramosa]
METSLLIDNTPRAAAEGKTFARRHPTDDRLITTVAAASIADARVAAESAGRAYATWSQTGPTERRRVLLRAADLVEEKVDEFVTTMALEVGASELWSRFNVGLTASLFREAASLATQIQGETIPTDKPGTLSMTIRQPVGVILSIAPWNGPVVLAARALAYPLVCGNTVVFRASETSPRTHALLVEILHAAGLPAGALNLLTTAPADAPAVIDELIAHPAVRRINFTGSTRVGRIIAQKAASHLKRCLLELGGKSPLIILKDANIDDAVRAAVFGSFLYQGQICMSTERLIVDASVADQVASKIADQVRTLPAGDPTENPSCVIGPMAFRESGARINALIEDALGKGATLLVGGRAEGATMPATVLDHVTSEMAIYDAETFGPITVMIRAGDTADAVRIANDTAYGLAASVFSRDLSGAIAVAMQLQSGSCHINGATVQNEAQAPFGGVKDSGYGRFDGRAVIDEFTELKWLTIEPSNQPYPF